MSDVFDCFWLLFWSPSCLKSSGRLLGTISTKSRPNPSPGVRVISWSVNDWSTGQSGYPSSHTWRNMHPHSKISYKTQPVADLAPVPIDIGAMKALPIASCNRQTDKQTGRHRVSVDNTQISRQQQ